ncbi:hypothetical protein PsYK624_127660 [Phanerochaete sordida]|uniref:SPT2-domain-containing protein n=1 Tax=Phanerochaete sordida TaxID=48140 RepID=A0A9P3LIV4_9APHY|nr:hypothetical protein PsYK624_127660 [Phanerochaete sordida]
MSAMNSFAALMALSASQTKQSEAQVQSQLAERKRREAQKRKDLEEKERKEREMEQKLRARALEEAQRAKEREQQLEAARRAKEATLKKKEGEQRDALRYGPKKTYPSSSSAARDEVRRRRLPDSDDEGGSALTREEKRQMRLQRELNYGAGTARRAVGGYKKSGRRLAGGAVDIDATAAAGSNGSGQYRSVKERLAHEPPGLIKLNVNKRDTRTIDEILQDRAKARNKTLAGDEAKQFDDWFGKGKSKAGSTAPPSPPSSIFSSRSNSPARAGPSESKVPSNVVSRSSKSLSGTPPVATQPSAGAPRLSYASKPATPALPAKGSGVQVKAVGGSRPADRPSANGVSTPKPANGRAAGVKAGASSSRAAAARPGATALRQTGASSSKLNGAGAHKKRGRSPSLSPSPPPAKRRSVPPPGGGGGGGNSISAEIWKIFGKDRNAYVARDVYSDDEDMEAGARDLESEELYSAKIARREDELAMEEERRHEEEKRRRKQKDFKEKRGAI